MPNKLLEKIIFQIDGAFIVSVTLLCD